MTISVCPHCGNRIDIEIKALPRQRRGKTTVFESSQRLLPNVAEVTEHQDFIGQVSNLLQRLAPKAKPEDSKLSPNPLAHLETPTHLPTLESHVKVPGLQAIITASFISPVVGTGTALFAYNFVYLTRGDSILVGFLFTGLSFFGIAWWQWSSRLGMYDSLLWKVEELFNTDLDGDKQVGKPEPRNIRVEYREPKGWRYADLPGDEIKLYGFAVSIANSIVTFSESGAVQAGYGVADFRKLRDIFIANNWAVWRNQQERKQGVELTLRGKAVLRDIAKNHPGGNGDIPGMSDHWVERGSGRESWL